MTARRRSINTYTTWGFVDYVDANGDLYGEYRELEMTGPISEAHRERGHRLRRARMDAHLTMKELAEASGLPDFGMVELSQAQAGIIELGEDEWAALYAALGREE